MTAAQRRSLWACVFALSFNFWYEASGRPLLNAPADDKPLFYGVKAREHFIEQTAYGALILGLGVALTLLLKRDLTPTEPYTRIDWALAAIFTGALLGILYRSYALISTLW